MVEQPKQIAVVKIVQQDLLVRVVYARDEHSRLWKRVEGLGEAKWVLIDENL